MLDPWTRELSQMACHRAAGEITCPCRRRKVIADVTQRRCGVHRGNARGRKWVLSMMHSLTRRVYPPWHSQMRLRDPFHVGNARCVGSIVRWGNARTDHEYDDSES